MLSRPQQIILKRAQAEAGITDFDYRSSIETVSGIPECLSSRDPRLTDRHLDNLLAYFEAIHWRAVENETLQPSCKPNAVFKQKGYWASKNPAGNTSRDQYGQSGLQPQIDAAEKVLRGFGYGPGYCAAIRNKLSGHGSLNLVNYLAALNRTIASKKRKAGQVDQPF